MDWIHLVQNWVQCRALVNTVTKFRVQYKTANFLANSENIRFEERLGITKLVRATNANNVIRIKTAYHDPIKNIPVTHLLLRQITELNSWLSTWLFTDSPLFCVDGTETEYHEERNRREPIPVEIPLSDISERSQQSHIALVTSLWSTHCKVQLLRASIHATAATTF